MDWAVLYLRLFIGGIVVLQNIGKLQNYNEIINTYPTIVGIPQAVSFSVISVVEVLLAVLIMMGMWVRLSAVIMAFGVIYLFITGLRTGEAQLLWLGIYVFLLVAGPGFYSFDATSKRNRLQKQTR